MPLTAGTRLGAYEITGAIGAGGMGEVYRARDTKLHRDVAVKVLPLWLMADPDQGARFDRTACLLATLNHPNIGAIYGVEDSGGVRALVLELVEGPTLAELLSCAPHPAPTAAAPSESGSRGAATRGRGSARVAYRRSARVRAADRGRVGRGSRARDRASRFEAGKRQNQRPRNSEVAGFRHRDAGGAPGRRNGAGARRTCRSWPDRWNRRVHVAGTDTRRARRFPVRSVFVGRHPLRDADRSMSVRAEPRPPRRWPLSCVTRRLRSNR